MVTCSPWRWRHAHRLTNSFRWCRHLHGYLGLTNSFSHRPQKDLQSSASSFLREAVSYSKVVVQQSEYPATAALLTTAERSRPWGSQAAPASLPPPSLLSVSMPSTASFCISSLQSLFCLLLTRNAMKKATEWLLYKAILLERLLDWRWRRLIRKSRTQIAWLRRLIGSFWKPRRSLIG